MSYYDLSAGEDNGCDGRNSSSSSSSSSSEDCDAEWRGGFSGSSGSSRSKKNAKDAADSNCNIRMNTPYGVPAAPNGKKNSGKNEASRSGRNDGRDPLWGRSVLHLDIDCFYCQCEEVDRQLRKTPHSDGSDVAAVAGSARSAPVPIRPMAIGQKHIIVTCNYEARKYGVKKLQSREAAMQACPVLMIVEGSDLRHYRRHSRAVYDSFRRAVLEIARSIAVASAPPGCDGDACDPDVGETELDPSGQGMSEEDLARHVPARKGTMDEMIVDLSYAVDSLYRRRHGSHHGIRRSEMSVSDEHLRLILCSDRPVEDYGWYIFGEGAASSVANMVEDQTGATTTISFQGPSIRLSESRRNVHASYGSGDRHACQQRLHIAARLATYICERIRRDTDFSTTVGISVSPLLAKLASGLNKPNSINMLYPWRSSALMYGMPLRKMHNVGYKTMKVLEGALSSSMSAPSVAGPASETGVKTVSDLLELPREKIVECLQGLQSSQKDSAHEQCDMLLNRCRGLDTSKVEDDEGGVPKTVSVENSFRRGTVRKMYDVWTALDELCIRLPRLLSDRASWSHDPSKAYPTTIRLTTRMVDSRQANQRRPFVTRSKQTAIDGKVLLKGAADALENETRQADILRGWATPLVQQLIPESGDINLTRLNLAVANFPDTSIYHKQPQSPSSQLDFLQPGEKQTTKRSLNPSSGGGDLMTNARSIKTRTLPPVVERKPEAAPSSLSKQLSRTKTTRIDQFFFRKTEGE